MSLEQDLAIRGESVQRVYQYYIGESFLVNRRYQRKLVWTIEEKQKFIDSLRNGYPVPIILLADVEYSNKKRFEIIDGMQRLNAIVSFIENEYNIDGLYFDLETMVETKSLLDKGILTQKTPTLQRDICSKIASYAMPLSVYSIAEMTKIDDIFKRINSYGKHLSKQELRVSGATSIFSSLVRKISSEIRMDTSASDILLLNNMKEISITNIKLDYGILVDKIFWVENYILTKEMVRESKDEEIISDIIVNIAMSGKQLTNSDNRDAFYGFRKSDLTTKINDAITKFGQDILHTQIIKTYDTIRIVLQNSNKNFRDLVFAQNTQKLPRYFTVIFLAFHELLFVRNKEIHDMQGLISILDKIANHIKITTGGNWSSKNIETNVNAVTGIIDKYFKESNLENPASHKWITEFETILTQSKVENVLYDFKQGILNLSSSPEINNDAIYDSVKRIVAMCNTITNSTAYICFGVADKKQDVDRIKELFDVSATTFRGYNITGISHEAEYPKISLDTYFTTITNKIRELPIDQETKLQLNANIKCISYYDKEIIMLKLKSANEPRIFDGNFFVRQGSSLRKLETTEMISFLKSYK